MGADGLCAWCLQPGAPAKPTGATATVTVKVGGEVVLAAGAIHSPQILMLSGIGPKQHLEDIGIKCIADIPAVGSNLQDHPACLSAFKLKESAGMECITDHVYDDNAKVRLRQMLNWAVLGKGPLTSTGCDRGAFIKSDASLPDPDLQIRYVAGFAINPDGIGSYVDFGKMQVRCNMR
jgi:fatty acid photodecarboxylase